MERHHFFNNCNTTFQILHSIPRLIKANAAKSVLAASGVCHHLHGTKTQCLTDSAGLPQYHPSENESASISAAHTQ